LTVTTICPEAIRMGWPSALPSNWCCTRTISKGHIDGQEAGEPLGSLPDLQ
jgi:Fur family ferric uptake transcriptional regulator